MQASKQRPLRGSAAASPSPGGFWSSLAVLGVGQRLQVVVRPWTTLEYGYLLHTHSHVALLGWVFNAFFVAALRHFVSPELACGYDRLSPPASPPFPSAYFAAYRSPNRSALMLMLENR